MHLGTQEVNRNLTIGQDRIVCNFTKIPKVAGILACIFITYPHSSLMLHLIFGCIPYCCMLWCCTNPVGKPPSR